MSEASENQPPPVKGKLSILELVQNDISERSDMGKKKYGTRLFSHNGRDALWDAYQEALDLVMYLRQAIAERTKEYCHHNGPGEEDGSWAKGWKERCGENK